MSDFRQRRADNFKRSVAWADLHPHLTVVVIVLVALLTFLCAFGAVAAAANGDGGEFLFLVVAGAYGAYSLRTWLRVRREIRR